ncbi:MAG TPA: response regulator transcription factor [Trebonia sp.]|nr:response regulator transcription factor [Trebonia sp.]
MFEIPIFRVLIADGDAPTLASLRRVFEEDDRFLVGAEIDNAAGAVAGAVREHPDICVLDIKLPGGGLSAAWEISARLPRVKLVMLTGSDDENDLFAALRAGADGYLLKTPRFDHLPDLIAGVCEGEAAVDSTFVGSLLRHFRTREPRWRRPVSPPPDGPHPSGADYGPADSRLTSREWEVLDLLSEGQSTADISRTLTISASAVRVHIAATVRKLGVADRAEAVEVLRGPAEDRSDN